MSYLERKYFLLPGLRTAVNHFPLTAFQRFCFFKLCVRSTSSPSTPHNIAQHSTTQNNTERTFNMSVHGSHIFQLLRLPNLPHRVRPTISNNNQSLALSHILPFPLASSPNPISPACKIIYERPTTSATHFATP